MAKEPNTVGPKNVVIEGAAKTKNDILAILKRYRELRQKLNRTSTEEITAASRALRDVRSQINEELKFLKRAMTKAAAIEKAARKLSPEEIKAIQEVAAEAAAEKEGEGDK